MNKKENLKKSKQIKKEYNLKKKQEKTNLKSKKLEAEDGQKIKSDILFLKYKFTQIKIPQDPSFQANFLQRGFQIQNIEIINSFMQNEDTQSKIQDQLQKKQFFDKTNQLINFTYEYHAYAENHLLKTIIISKHDIDGLCPNTYINDQIICFYLKYIQTQILNDVRKEKVFVFNTYFFQKLNQQIYPLKVILLIITNSGPEELIYFRKKSQSFQQIEKKINIGVYLLLSIQIIFQKNTNKSHQISQNYKEPMILYFDSLGTIDLQEVKNLRNYLQAELKDKKPEIMDLFQQHQIQLDEKFIQNVQPLTLCQKNYFDCGLYLLEYAENLMENPDYIINQIHDNITTLQWFPKILVENKRNDILEIFLQLKQGKSIQDCADNYIQNRKNILFQVQNDNTQFEQFDEYQYKAYICNKLQRPNDIHQHSSQEIQELKINSYLNIHCI